LKTLVWSGTFIRALKRIARSKPDVRIKIEQALQTLAENPLHPSLRSHKLRGELEGIWACSVDYNNRILYKFVLNEETREEELFLLTVGSHDEVY
jgi:mRNA interferase YafQ